MRMKKGRHVLSFLSHMLAIHCLLTDEMTASAGRSCSGIGQGMGVQYWKGIMIIFLVALLTLDVFIQSKKRVIFPRDLKGHGHFSWTGSRISLEFRVRPRVCSLLLGGAGRGRLRTPSFHEGRRTEAESWIACTLYSKTERGEFHFKGPS